MLFHSYVFMFVFLPVTMAGFALVCRRNLRLAMGWLVVCSLFFYGWWNPVYLSLLVVSCGVNFAFGKALERSPSPRTLILGIVFNLGLIGYFKYGMFLTGFWSDIAGVNWRLEDIILPLGISFFTFQQIAYLVDTHQQRTVEHGWLEYVLFVTFFPQLIAGPIVHQAEMLPQFMNKRLGLRSRDFAIGLTIFAAGLFKKVVLAETLSSYAAPMFHGAANGEIITFFEAWGGTIAFTFQLYFDFSGYSDMAIGLGRMFGIRLPVNFNSPLRATSIIEFWQRWHMTLTRFFINYIFNPVALRQTRKRARAGKPLIATDLTNPVGFLSLMAWPMFLTFFLVGVWHGAGWTFLLFGALHGVFLVSNHAWRAMVRNARWKERVPQTIRLSVAWTVTFLSVAVTLILFRAQDLNTAFNVMVGMTGMDGRFVITPGYVPLKPLFYLLFDDVTVSPLPLLYYAGREQVAWIAASLLIVLLVPNTQAWMSRYYPTAGMTPKITGAGAGRLFWRPIPAWGAFTIILIGLSLVSAMQPTEFLYFQF
jgi:D-alanyl-lipoteichoic acid acyltransferase DltB (MBOAT superfamily)